MWSVSINRTSPGSPFTFRDLLSLQNETLAHEQLGLGHSLHTGTLLFAEVEPVITLGQKQIAWNQIPPSIQQDIDQKALTVVAGERGGNETWHGPGQWICFMVTPLEKWTGDSRGVGKAMDKTLHRLLPVIQSYIPEARIEEGVRLGIWSNAGKVVSIGIKIRGGWMTSGFAVNAYPTEQSFKRINPCGLEAKPDFLFSSRLNKKEWGEKFAHLPTEILEKLFL